MGVSFRWPGFPGGVRGAGALYGFRTSFLGYCTINGLFIQEDWENFLGAIGRGNNTVVGAAIGRPPVGSGCISRTSDARRVRRNSLHSISPVCVRAGETSYPLLPSSSPNRTRRAAVGGFAALRMRRAPCGYFAGLRLGAALSGAPLGKGSLWDAAVFASLRRWRYSPGRRNTARGPCRRPEEPCPPPGSGCRRGHTGAG